MVYEDGDMMVCGASLLETSFTFVWVQVYRRDLEEGGVVVDPLKAQHTVQVSHALF